MHTRFETVMAAVALALAAATTASGSVELKGPGTVRIADIQRREGFNFDVCRLEP